MTGKIVYKSSKVLIFVGFICGLILGVGGLYGVQSILSDYQIVKKSDDHVTLMTNRTTIEDVSKDLDRIDSARSALPEAEIALRRGFEDVLNNFLKRMGEQTRAYMKNKKALKEMARPSNLSNAQYIEDNFTLAKSLLPNLQRDIDSILAEFSNTETTLTIMLEGQPVTLQRSIMKSWNEMKDQQAEIYVDYFTAEQASLDLYAQMMLYLHTHREDIYHDAISNTLRFRRDGIEQSYLDMKSKIASINDLQALIIAN